MRRLLYCFIFVVLVLTTCPAWAQYEWFIDLAGQSYVGAEDISIDANGNVLTIGNFNDGITIGTTTYSGRGSFLLKLSKDGVHHWDKIIRYGEGDFWSVNHVETDGAGNAYIAAMFRKTITIDGITVPAPDVSNVIAKFNPAGDLIWTRVIPDLQEVFDFKVNTKGDILVFSFHYASLTYDNISFPVGSNSFAMLLDSEGKLQWKKTIGEPDTYQTWPKACALDEAGNAFLHGIYRNTVLVDGKQIVSTGGTYDLFFAAINTSGVCQWLTAAERKLPPEYETSNPPSGLIVERGALAVDDQGNLYGGGVFWQGMKAGNFSVTGSGAFLLKLDPKGVPVWLEILPGTNAQSSTVDDIVVKDNLVYLAGLNGGQLYFSIYEKSGQRRDFVSLSIFGDIASGLALDANSTVYMSGRKSGPTNLQGFIFKYGISAPVTAGNISGPFFFCISEPSITFQTSAVSGATGYEWEITSGNNVQLVFTADAQLVLQISPSEISGDVIVRVRGVNESGKGPYSAPFVAKAETALAPPQLSSSCAGIELLGEYSAWKWYQDEILASEYDSKIIRPTSSGTFHVVVTNTCGEATSQPMPYVPTTLADIFMPNIITPNYDDLNEFFIVDEKFETPALLVFNRWGKEVYASRSYTNNWNGEDLAPGVYFYQLQTKCFATAITGTLTITK
jgi:gliding motility-associated-like protein